MLFPLKLRPAFKDYMWGGTKLRDEFNKKSGSAIIAESWEVSTHPDGLSTVAGGEFDGQTLKAVLDVHPEWLGEVCAGTSELPVLVKLIDSGAPLSLQVHPNDDYARRAENQSGKNEMWYIVSAEPGAELILGFTKKLPRTELRELIESGEILSFVHRVKVKAGDCYTIPAGLLHAIGKGIVIAEVQQCSNLTYRVYDYGRVDSEGRPRALHIDKALDVLDTGLQAEPAGSDILTDWEYFRSECVFLGGDALTSPRVVTEQSFECLTVIDAENGIVTLNHGAGELCLHKGESVFIPAGLGEYVLSVAAGSARLLAARM